MQKDDRGMAIARSCVSTMAKHRVRITSSPESATCLYSPNTRKIQAGRLANLPSHYSGRCVICFSHGQCYCGTWAEQSRMSSLALGPRGLAIGKGLGSDAGFIPGVERSVSPLIWRNTSHSRFILGWICPTSAILHLGFYSISGVAETTPVCYSTRRS